MKDEDFLDLINNTSQLLSNPSPFLHDCLSVQFLSSVAPYFNPIGKSRCGIPYGKQQTNHKLKTQNA